MIDYPIHEAATIVPVDESTIPELSISIKQFGQKHPICVYQGKILDGRRRLRACELAGVVPLFRNVDDEVDDPLEYVWIENVLPRHLTQSQKTLAGLKREKIREEYEKGAKERQKEAIVRGNKTRHGKSPIMAAPPGLAKKDGGTVRRQLADAIGVGVKSIDYGKKVLKKGTLELIEAVEKSEIALESAAVLADEPPEVQREEVKKPKGERTKVSASRNGVASGRDPDSNPEDRKVLGKGVFLATEAINCLMRIPKNDALRLAGFKLVTDWIRRHK